MKAYRFPEYDTPVRIGGEARSCNGRAGMLRWIPTVRCKASEINGNEIRRVFVFTEGHVMRFLQDEFHHAEEEG